MMRITLGKNIYPDLNEEILEDLKRITKLYEIKISFLLDDGVEFTCPDTYSTDNRFGDIRIIINENTFVCYYENYNELTFILVDGKKSKQIIVPILEENKLL